MSRYWSAVVHRLTPYVPGEQPQHPNLVKLNTNENPWPPSPRALQAIREATDASLRLYPDPDSTRLKQALADHFDLRVENVFVGNGSDEVLAHTFQALLKHEAPLLFPDISYSFYPVYCGLFEIDYRTVPLRDDFTLALEDYDQPNGGIIFPNPNAPTGRALPRREIEALLQRNPDSVVVVDEAYVDFGAESAVPLIPHYDNLLVIQTFSKSRSLAGLRLGYALGAPALIEALVRVKDSFNSYPIDRLAEAAGVASLQDEAYFRETCARIVTERERVSTALSALGFEVLPSRANFVFARPHRPAEAVMQALREQGIIVRHFKAPRIRDWLRITIGTPQENDALLHALEGIVHEAG